MNSDSSNQQNSRHELDRTYVEGTGSQQIGYSPLQPGQRIDATAIPSVNPYTIAGNHQPPATADHLPSGNEPIPLGSGIIVGLLGTGGMAKVYKIWNEKLEVFRAVKILIPTQQTDLRNRFETEAKITAKLHHPNIVEVYGVGDWNGLPYLEMEYLDGISLEALIVTNGKLPDVVCSAISILIARALEYAHSHEFLIYGKTYHGVIHRDLKPANIMIPNIGDVRLMDFGIARPTEASLHTVEGNIVGTMQYLSPEQIDGVDIDARTDIYSFGAILYEMLTGTKTFPQNTITNLMKKKVMNEYRRFSDFDFPIENHLGHIAQKCLQTEKTERYANASSLLADFEAAHRSLTSESPTKILKEYMSNPESIEYIQHKRNTLSISPKIILPVVGLTGIIALLALFIITGPQKETSSLLSMRKNSITQKPNDTTTLSPSHNQEVKKDTVVQQVTVTPPRPETHTQVKKTPEKNTRRRITPSSARRRIPSSTRTAKRTVVPKKKSDSQLKHVVPDTIIKKSIPQPEPILTPIEKLKKRYNQNDLLKILDIAFKNNKYDDVIFTFNNLLPNEKNSITALLTLFHTYIKSEKLGDALTIANNKSITDAQFDYLCGILYEKTGKNKKALQCYQIALTKPSVIRSRTEIRNDALYRVAILWTSIHQSNPSSDSKIQALNAWNTVKRIYMSTPTHPRFKKANVELNSIQ